MEATKEMILLFLHAIQRTNREAVEDIGKGFISAVRKANTVHTSMLVLERVIIRGLPEVLYPLTIEEKQLADTSADGSEAMLKMNSRLSLEVNIGDIAFFVHAFQILGEDGFNNLLALMEEVKEKAVVRAIMAPAQ